MWTALLWKIVWLVIPFLLDVAKSFINDTIGAVKEAETSGLSSEEKKDLVLEKMESSAKVHGVDGSKRVLNALLELAVNYVKYEWGKLG
jgi:hypothetical protein